jgi:hypothetical protein
MELFQKIKMEGNYWAVFLVNCNNHEDRYLVSSSFDKESEADELTSEFNRIAEAKNIISLDDSCLAFPTVTRKILLRD